MTRSPLKPAGDRHHQAAACHHAAAHHHHQAAHFSELGAFDEATEHATAAREWGERALDLSAAPDGDASRWPIRVIEH